jgi:hypothetical protein
LDLFDHPTFDMQQAEWPEGLPVTKFYRSAWDTIKPLLLLLLLTPTQLSLYCLFSQAESAYLFRTEINSVIYDLVSDPIAGSSLSSSPDR